MSKINKERARFFIDWGKKDVGFFTSDNLPFFEEGHAHAHARNLPVKTVDTHTRDEYNAWLAADAPAQLEGANTELAAANKELTDAQAAVDGLSAKTAAAKKAPYYAALNKAKARVANATTALEVAQEAVEALEPKTIEHVVTKEDLDNNPELGAQGVKEDEVIEIPVDDTQATPEEIAADVKAAAKKPVKKKTTKK